MRDVDDMPAVTRARYLRPGVDATYSLTASRWANRGSLHRARFLTTRERRETFCCRPRSAAWKGRDARWLFVAPVEDPGEVQSAAAAGAEIAQERMLAGARRVLARARHLADAMDAESTARRARPEVFAVGGIRSSGRLGWRAYVRGQADAYASAASLVLSYLVAECRGDEPR